MYNTRDAGVLWIQIPSFAQQRPTHRADRTLVHIVYPMGLGKGEEASAQGVNMLKHYKDGNNNYVHYGAPETTAEHTGDPCRKIETRLLD